MPAELPHRALLRSDALAEGRTDDEIARLLRAGTWARLRRGAYLPAPVPAEDRVTRHRLLVRATLAAMRRPAVVSHQSAAVLLGLSLWNVRLDKVHVTRRPPASSGVTGLVRCHVARLRDDEVVRVDGVQVTDPVRTALDLARSLPFETAVAVLDTALHTDRLTRERLQERLFDIAGTRGSRAAARAVAFADGRSESVGESRSRVLLHDLGLAPTTLQLEIRSATGSLLGRADFGWEQHRVVGEFDGRVKYGRLLRPGQEPGDVVFAEKRREDAIRDQDWGVVRWTWPELAAPRRLGTRVHEALERGTRRSR
jgi:hypothetical protein